jgi:hypothetical protein
MSEFNGFLEKTSFDNMNVRGIVIVIAISGAARWS